MRIGRAALSFAALVAAVCSCQQPATPSAGDAGTSDADSDADSDGDGGADGSVSDPLFGEVGVYETVIQANGDEADVYYPDPPDLREGGYSFPVALLLQGANVGKEHYSGFARLVAAHGFIVVVPDHQTMGATGPGLWAEQFEAQDVVAHMTAQDADPGSPVQGVVDEATLALLGHSYGGVCGLAIVRGVCEMPTCVGLTYDRPPQLAAAAFYGTNVAMPFIGSVIHTIANDGVPVAMVQGTLDSKALPEDTQDAYVMIQDPPKAYVGIVGANHYGLCDANNPPGAAADGNLPTLAQGVSIETAARWSAVFLRAYAAGDEAAREYIHGTGGPSDPNVNVVAAE
jgi:dienelactone hydrolase